MFSDLQDQINVLALSILPVFLSLKPNIHLNGPEDVIKKSHVLDSFILIVEDDGKIDERIAEVDKFHTDHKLTFIRPLVILCGTFDNVQKTYVLINGYKHSFDNILKAVQFCFISYKALQLDFSELCKPAWAFIQRKIYKIQLSRGISCVDNLVRLLTNLNVQS